MLYIVSGPNRPHTKVRFQVFLKFLSYEPFYYTTRDLLVGVISFVFNPSIYSYSPAPFLFLLIYNTVLIGLLAFISAIAHVCHDRGRALPG